MLRHPRLVRQLASVRSQIHTTLSPLEASIATSPEPVPFAKRELLARRPVRAGSRWGRAHTCAWFHATLDLRPHLSRAGGAHDLALILDTDGEALVLTDDGEVVGMVTSRLTPIDRHAPARAKTRLELTPELLSRAAPDGRLSLWLDAGFNGKLVQPFGVARVRQLDLVRIDRAAEVAYLDLLAVAYASLRAGAHEQMYAGALAAAFAAAERRDWSGTRRELAPVLRGAPEESLALTALGHAHLDMAWLWPIRETRRKARRTFRAQLDLLESHVGTTFGASQPQQFAWIEEDDPELFARIGAAVAGGRFELQGGFWIEPDTNLPSGESLVRQAIHGQRYWESRFGQRVTTCWLPDAFGYSGALPQILRGAGMESFLTIKLAWNEHNNFPHRSFVWEGIDGTGVLVHMPPEGTYTSAATGQSLGMARDQYPEAQVAPIAMVLYGTGDGGGGPSEVHLALAERGSSLLGLPPLAHGTATEFFGELTAYAEQLPRWQGELYLEKHQGTFTTQAEVKAGNRRLEHELHDLEYLAAQAHWQHGQPWPGALLDATWEEVLLHQFHDMLPGSSIERVHRETREAYSRLSATVFDATATALAVSHDDALPPALVNTTPVRRRGHVEHAGQWWTHDAAPFETVMLEPFVEGDEGGQLGHDGSAIWNDLLRVEFAADGTIRSLVDRRTGRQHARGALNSLVVHRDPFLMFNAWDIKPDYVDRARDVLTPTSSRTFRDGPRIIRRHEYRHGRTSIRQDVVLTPGAESVLFETTVDWQERLRMLRAEFEPEAWSDEVACEIQFGHLMRSTRDDTPQERAQYEICAHRWVDLSDERGFGFSVLNDSKYGHRVKQRLISLNLLRAPVYPDRSADRGRHTFTYAVHPHEGGLGPSTTREARHLNAPLVVAQVPAARPSVVVSPETVLLDTVTLDAATGDLVLRLYESAGRATKASIELAEPWASAEDAQPRTAGSPSPGDAEVAGTPGHGRRLSRARRVNLLLDDLGPADLAALELHPFELVTLRVPRT